jgi:hypothetical protein
MPPPYRLIVDRDLDRNSLKSVALGPDDFMYPTPDKVRCRSQIRTERNEDPSAQEPQGYGLSINGLQ